MRKSIDWADEVPQDILNELIQSIEDAENGEIGSTHDEMKIEARKDFPNLVI